MSVASGVGVPVGLGSGVVLRVSVGVCVVVAVGGTGVEMGVPVALGAVTHGALLPARYMGSYARSFVIRKASSRESGSRPPKTTVWAPSLNSSGVSSGWPAACTRYQIQVHSQ